ncbi:MAG: hypothetical protein KF791_13330 [Verrucomicrobiae bacterium]|nr:hypothetical protein [Verrucomicrobiae bacterium]
MKTNLSKTMRPTTRSFTAPALGTISLLAGLSLSGATVDLQNATATFSQTYFDNFSVATAINGTSGDGLGWAIYDGDEQFGTTSPQTAVFETGLDVGAPGGSYLDFTLEFNNWNPYHLLGSFRLSATTDSRASFADGLSSGGDVTANWTILNVVSVGSMNGTTLTAQGDGSVLASGDLPATDTYTVRTSTSLVGITGFRLEVLADPTLPTDGPGRQPQNGNFVLSEFSVALTAIPEPRETALVAGLLGIGGWLVRRRRA